MTKTIKELKAQRDTLDQQIKDLIQQENDRSREAWEQIELTYIYTVTWFDEFSLRIDRVLSDESKQVIIAFKEEFPHSSVYTRDLDASQGMKFYLLGDRLVGSGGGFVVVREDGHDKLHNSYAKLTTSEYSHLKDGVFPTSLAYKSKW